MGTRPPLDGINSIAVTRTFDFFSLFALLFRILRPLPGHPCLSFSCPRPSLRFLLASSTPHLLISIRWTFFSYSLSSVPVFALPSFSSLHFHPPSFTSFPSLLVAHSRTHLLLFFSALQTGHPARRPSW